MSPCSAFRAPLFDRLADDSPDEQTEPIPLRNHDLAAALQSVRRDLSRLLNTRRATALYGTPPTIIDYGIPDWSTFGATQPQAQRVMERSLTALIRTFEPRIVQPVVRIAPLPGQAQRLQLQISGHMAHDAVAEPVMFMDTVLDGNHLEHP